MYHICDEGVPEALNQAIDSLQWMFPSKSDWKKGILCDATWFTMPPGLMKRCWRFGKDEEYKGFFDVVFPLAWFDFIFKFLFYRLLQLGGKNMEGLRGEHN